VTSSAGLDGEAVRDVVVLERFSFLSVPEAEAERVIAAFDGHALGERADGGGKGNEGESPRLERVQLR